MFTIPLLAISLQPGGQLILIDPNMFLLRADFYKPVRSLGCGLFPLVLLINRVLTLAIKPASSDSPWLAMQPFSRWSLSSGAFKTSGSKNQALGMTAHDVTLEEICFSFLWDVCCFRILRGTLSWLKKSSGDESKEDATKRFHYHPWQGVWVGGGSLAWETPCCPGCHNSRDLTARANPLWWEARMIKGRQPLQC